MGLQAMWLYFTHNTQLLIPVVLSKGLTSLHIRKKAITDTHTHTELLVPVCGSLVGDSIGLLSNH